MKQYEYRREFVPRYYNRIGMELEVPEIDILKKLGKQGWLLCSQSAGDSVGTKILYFVREVKTK